jgi:ATP-binding cassette subfamily B protein
MWEFNRIYRNLEGALTDAAQFADLLLDPPSVQDVARPVPFAPRDHSVEMRDISFRHSPAQPLLFDRFSLTIAAGTKLGLVGRSGGGKTTITRLLLRFKDVERGQILVGGQSIADVPQSSLRESIAYVPQDPAMFHRTIADNIRFARPEASDEEVADVAQAVGLERIVRRFEEGLLHEVREGGSGLSAGERQLISIARALLADPRILIFDEATSNIDRPTEVLIETALDRLLRGRTSIIIAHRLATVRRADEILVLVHGRIAQRGRFDELLAASGPFRQLAHELEGSSGLQDDASTPVTGSRDSRSASVASSEPE